MPFDTKYRPRSVAECIGHTAAVTSLRGYLKSGRPPSLLLFTGPTSVGKTTLGRAFAGDLNGYNEHGDPYDYQEVDGPSYRTKEELTALVRTSAFMPQKGKYRIILIDEFQHVLGNAQAVPVLLKAFEEPSPRTIWIICSMDPAKFQTDKNGKAILTRAAQFSLSKPTDADMFKQGVRIIKGEKIKCIRPELLKEIVKNCNGEMRTLAITLENLVAYHAGLPKPRMLTAEDLPLLLKTADADTVNASLKYMTALYSGSFVDAQLAILDADDPVSLVNQSLWAAKFMLNVAVLNGRKHSKVWWTPANRELHAAVGKMKKKPSIGDLGAAVAMLVKVRSQVAYGNLDDTLTAATFAYLNGEE